MTHNHLSTIRRLAERAGQRLTAIALGGLALGTFAAVPAQAAPIQALVQPIAGASGIQGTGGAAAPLPTFINVNKPDWSTYYDSNYNAFPPGAFLDSQHFVHLQGAAQQAETQAANPNELGTLPTGFAPSQTVFAIAHTMAGTYTDVMITTSGQIWMIPPRSPAVTDFSFVSLEGITWYAGAERSCVADPGFVCPITPGQNFANASAQYDSWSPSVSLDHNNVVHLMGGFKQLNPSNSYQLLGTLPGYAAPVGHNVFAIVHTNDGTYADVMITTSGQIWIIPPRSTAVTDFSYVSLDSVSYVAAPSSTLESASISHASNFLPTPQQPSTQQFGASSPTAYLDSDTFVHLSGALTETASSSAYPMALGYLPSVFTPNHDVYTIVHTMNGTYADLYIDKAGTIWLLHPRSPAVTDYSFVSLEGVTFRLT